MKRRRRGCSSTGVSRRAEERRGARQHASGAQLGAMEILHQAFLVVLDAQMGDLLFAHQVAQGVLELGLLDEQVVLRDTGPAPSAGS